MKTAVIGCGRWGSMLANILSDISEEVILIGLPTEEDFQELNLHRENKFLRLAEKVTLSWDINRAFEKTKLIIVAINGQNFRDFLDNHKKLFYEYNGQIVIQMKALEENTGKNFFEIYNEEIGKDNITMLVGPAHPRHLLRGEKAKMVLTGYPDATFKVSSLYKVPNFFQITTNLDMKGVALCSSLKNPAGLGAGILYGLGVYPNYIQMFLDLITEETKFLLDFLMAEPETADGPAFKGDLEVTAEWPKCQESYNFQFGNTWVTKNSWDKIAEGVGTLKSLNYLTQGFREPELRLFSLLYEIFFKQKDPRSLIEFINDEVDKRVE